MSAPDTPSIVLVGPDGAFLNAVATALGPVRSVAAAVVAEGIEQAAGRPELQDAAVVVVDLDARRRESLIALQGLTGRIAARTPVIVLADAIDDALMRWFLQIRVADFLRKPVDPKEVLRACVRALRATADGPGGSGQILSFMAAAGGVGATTLAIEAAMLHLRDAKAPDTVCLVDLDFQIVIDLPRAWDAWTDQVLLGSTHVYVVTDMTVPGLRFGRRAADALAARLPDLKPRVIVNRFEQQLLFGTGLRRADVERALEGILEGTVSNNYKLVREAIDRGLPLDAIKAGSNVSIDLRKIIFNQHPAE
jgi:Flp pilus assembly CpaE family ATPase